MKALIIDDERPARAELRRLLTAHSEIEIVGEAINRADALDKIRSLHPDLIFLDIQMPGGTGFDLLEQLEEKVPRIIFTTAYDEFALRAFEVNALDYLLKPIQETRLTEALSRVQRMEPETDSEANSDSNEMALQESDRVFLRENDRCWFVPVKEIRLLESEGNYTRLHVGKERPLLYRSLLALEKRLPGTIFFRANRTQMLNLNWIESIEPWFSGGLKVGLKTGESIEISRRQAQAFREKMSL
jgi:two-component system LytT family response regulator